jgi:hypothetical protein
VVSTAVWRSISACSSAPTSTTTTDSQIQVMNPTPRRASRRSVVAVEARDVPGVRHGETPTRIAAATALPRVTQRHLAGRRLGPKR